MNVLAPEKSSTWIYFLRRWLNRDASRIATLVHWAVYDEVLARKELRGIAYGYAVRAKMDGLKWRPVSDQAFADAYAMQETQHRDSLAAMTGAAMAAIQSGGGVTEARQAIGQTAITRPLAPPLWLLEQALAEAMQEHRRAAAWTRKLEAARL